MAVTCLLLESSTPINNHNQFDPMMPMCLYPPGGGPGGWGGEEVGKGDGG
jgi:hypothetical protein